ncbi:hypothetical protein ENBRE01_3114, partial [Enteropsectra breve]
MSSFDPDTDSPLVFKDRISIRSYIYEYNARLQKAGRVRQSNKWMFLMTCTDDNCNFRFEARKNKQNEFVVTLFDRHSCTLQKLNIKSKLIAERMRSVENTISGVKPRDCIAHMQNAHGLTTNYHGAYAGLRHLRKEKQQDEMRSYSLIEPWLNKMVEIQDNARVDYQVRSLESGAVEFEYCAFIPAFSRNSFQYALPILALDACHTKGKYKGVIMIVTAVTGEDKGIIL